MEANDKTSPFSETYAQGTPYYQLHICPNTVMRVLSLIALLLLANHAILTYYHYQIQEIPWLLRQLFDVDEEHNLPTWFSGSLLLLTSQSVWLCAHGQPQNQRHWQRHWNILTFGFLLLAIDEIAGLHETLNSVTDLSWAYVGAPIALITGLLFLPFLRALPRQTALRFVFAGGLYIGGAVGMEIIGEPMSSDTLEYNLTTLIEEGLEMFGVIVFLHTLLLYMRGSHSNEIDTRIEIG